MRDPHLPPAQRGPRLLSPPPCEAETPTQTHSATGKRGLFLGIWRSIREPGVVSTHHLQLRHRATQGPFLAVHKRICRTERRNHHDGSPVSLGIPPLFPPPRSPCSRPGLWLSPPTCPSSSRAQHRLCLALEPEPRAEGAASPGQEAARSSRCRGQLLPPCRSTGNLPAPLLSMQGEGSCREQPLWGHGTQRGAPSTALTAVPACCVLCRYRAGGTS